MACYPEVSPDAGVVDDQATVETDGDPTKRVRRDELGNLLAGLKLDHAPEDGHFMVLATLIVDAALDADEETLRDAVVRLQWQHEMRSRRAASSDDYKRCGRFLGLIDIAQWALQRVPAMSLVPCVEPGSLAEDFLRFVRDNPGCSNEKLVSNMDRDKTQVSRVGWQLVEKGLAAKARAGRHNRWQITPRGRKTLLLLGEQEPEAQGVLRLEPARFEAPTLQREESEWLEGELGLTPVPSPASVGLPVRSS